MVRDLHEWLIRNTFPAGVEGVAQYAGPEDYHPGVKAYLKAKGWWLTPEDRPKPGPGSRLVQVVIALRREAAAHDRPRDESDGSPAGSDNGRSTRGGDPPPLARPGRGLKRPGPGLAGRPAKRVRIVVPAITGDRGESAVLPESTRWLDVVLAGLGDQAGGRQPEVVHTQWRLTNRWPVREFGAVGEAGRVYEIQLRHGGTDHTVLGLVVPMRGQAGPSRLAAVIIDGEVHEPSRADLVELAGDNAGYPFAGLRSLPDADQELLRWLESNADLRGSDPDETSRVISRLIFFGMWLKQKRPDAGGVGGAAQATRRHGRSGSDGVPRRRHMGVQETPDQERRRPANRISQHDDIAVPLTCGPRPAGLAGGACHTRSARLPKRSAGH